MIAIREIDFFGKLEYVDTSAETMWQEINGVKVFIGDFIGWYCYNIESKDECAYRTGRTIEESLIARKKKDMIATLIAHRFGGYSGGRIVVVDKRFTEYSLTCRARDNVAVKKIMTAPKDDKRFMHIENSNIAVLFIDEYTFNEFVKLIDTFLSVDRLYLRYFPSEFWKAVLGRFSKSKEEFIDALENKELEIDCDGRIVHRRHIVEASHNIINTELTVSSLEFEKSTFIRGETSEPPVLTASNTKFHGCTLLNLSIVAGAIDADDKVVHGSTKKHNATVCFSHCIFNKCSFNARDSGRFYFRKCTFRDCSTLPSFDGEFYYTHFFGNNDIKNVWEYTSSVYFVNKTAVHYIKQDKPVFEIALFDGQTEYANPGNMIKEGSTLKFDYAMMQEPHVTMKAHAEYWEQNVKTALKMFNSL